MRTIFKLLVVLLCLLALGALCFYLYLYFLTKDAEKEIQRQLAPIVDMGSSSRVYKSVTEGHPYQFKIQLSDYALMAYAEQSLTRAKPYFSLLNRKEDDPSGGAFMSSLEGQSIAIAEFSDKPKKFPAPVFDAKEVRKAIRKEYGLPTNKERIEKLNARIVDAPLDLEAYEEKERILADRAIYEDGDWDAVIEVISKQIEILANDPNKTNKAKFKASLLLDLLVCLDREQDFSRLIGKGTEHISAHLSTAGHPGMKDEKAKTSMCRMIGITR